METKVAAFLIGLSSAKLDKLESALERNWIVHLVLGGVGIALVLNIGDLPNVLAEHFVGKPLNPSSAAAIFAPVFLYHFMRFGYLLTAFLDIRRLHESLFENYFAEQHVGNSFTALRETTSFFEEIYATKSFRDGWPLVVTYFLVGLLVFASGQ